MTDVDREKSFNNYYNVVKIAIGNLDKKIEKLKNNRQDLIRSFVKNAGDLINGVKVRDKNLLGYLNLTLSRFGIMEHVTISDARINKSGALEFYIVKIDGQEIKEWWNVSEKFDEIPWGFFDHISYKD